MRSSAIGMDNKRQRSKGKKLDKTEGKANVGHKEIKTNDGRGRAAISRYFGSEDISKAVGENTGPSARTATSVAEPPETLSNPGPVSGQGSSILNHHGDIKGAAIGVYGSQSFRGIERLQIGHTYNNYTERQADHEIDLTKIFQVPNRRIRIFVGRKGILSRISNAHSADSQSHIVVLRGLGGQGKTQIALEYCHSRKGSQAVLWVDATSESALRKSYETLAERINPGANLSSSEEKIDSVKRTVESWASPSLLVFDNHDDPKSFSNFQDYLPESQYSSILITSRHSDVGALAEDDIELLGLDESEALELLLKQSSKIDNEDSRMEGERIVSRLGYHALAIAQAGSYIKQRKLALSNFMEHYDKSRDKILREILPSTPYRRKLDDAGETALSVYTSWELSYQQLLSQSSDHAVILTIFAFFDNKDISEELFSAYSNSKWKVPKSPISSKIRSILQDINGHSHKAFGDILVVLEQFALVQSFFQDDFELYHISLHPLVKDWIRLRTSCTTQNCQEYTLVAAAMIHSLLHGHRSDNHYQFELVERQWLLSHINAHNENLKIHFEAASRSSLSERQKFDFFRHESEMAKFLDREGRYEDSELIQRRVLAGREAMLGKDHPDTLSTIGRLGRLLAQKNVLEAEILTRRAWETSMRLFGEEDSRTLDYKSDLAGLLRQQNIRLEEAEQMLSQVLEIKRKTLGREASETLTSMNALAICLAKQNKYQESEPMLRELLKTRSDISGQEDPRTLTNTSNLAKCLINQGKYNEAEQTFRKSWELCKKVHGEEHPNTLDSLHELGLCLEEQERYQEQEFIHHQVLTLRTQALGEKHPKTITSMRGLAACYGNQGRYQEAGQLMHQALGLLEKAIGETHIKTYQATGDLAFYIGKQDRFEEAALLYNEALAGLLRVAGTEHEYTVYCQEDYSEMLARKAVVKGEELSDTVASTELQSSGKWCS